MSEVQVRGKTIHVSKSRPFQNKCFILQYGMVYITHSKDDLGRRHTLKSIKLLQRLHFEVKIIYILFQDMHVLSKWNGTKTYRKSQILQHVLKRQCHQMDWHKSGTNGQITSLQYCRSSFSVKNINSIRPYFLKQCVKRYLIRLTLTNC